jgi:hypothetical protein
LLVVTVEGEAAVLGVLDQITVEIVDVSLPGGESVVGLVDGGEGQFIDRQNVDPDLLIPARAVAETGVTESLFPVLGCSCFLNGFSEPVDIDGRPLVG